VEERRGRIEEDKPQRWLVIGKRRCFRCRVDDTTPSGIPDRVGELNRLDFESPMLDGTAILLFEKLVAALVSFRPLFPVATRFVSS
jgi:hypothetical protein